jgi:serine/threonine protein kinase
MSPEQARGEHLDERSDLFSLGSTFFHVFTGRLAFDGPTPADILRQLSQCDPPRIRDVAPDLPPALGVIIDRMLARKREERYQDVGVLLADLESYAVRELLPVADSGSFPASTAADDLLRLPSVGQETSAYVPPVPSDPLVGSS